MWVPYGQEAPGNPGKDPQPRSGLGGGLSIQNCRCCCSLAEEECGSGGHGLGFWAEEAVGMGQNMGPWSQVFEWKRPVSANLVTSLPGVTEGW